MEKYIHPHTSANERAIKRAKEEIENKEKEKARMFHNQISISKYSVWGFSVSVGSCICMCVCVCVFANFPSSPGS